MGGIAEEPGDKPYGLLAECTDDQGMRFQCGSPAGSPGTVAHRCTTTYGQAVISTTVSEARATLPALLARVEAGEEVTLTRHGRPVAVLVRPDTLRVRRADRAMRGAQEIHDMLESARHEPLSAGGLSPGRAEELIREIRADRDRD